MSEIARLRWRCRRGTRELEYLLQQFLDRHLGREADELEVFERLLECEDDRLIDWLIKGDDPANEELCVLVQRMRDSFGC